jgi:hypothetical protein
MDAYYPATEEEQTRAYRRTAIQVASGTYRLNWWRNVFIATVAIVSLANFITTVVIAARGA